MTTPTNGSIGLAYLEECRRRLAACLERIEHCVGQLDDRQLWWRPRESMNSIANVLLHLCGNLRQWIVAGVPGTPDDRDRPGEFSRRDPIPKDELLRRLKETVTGADAVLALVPERQLLQPRRIQGFDVTVLEAVFGCVAHLAGHTQEIIYATRLQLGDAYRFAWTPETPEQGAPAVATTAPAAGEVAAPADAIFERGLGNLPPPDVTPPPGSGPAPELRPKSPLRDYLRDLQQEFQEDQEKGKL
jgi:hypothetical protein